MFVWLQAAGGNLCRLPMESVVTHPQGSRSPPVHPSPARSPGFHVYSLSVQQRARGPVARSPGHLVTRSPSHPVFTLPGRGRRVTGPSWGTHQWRLLLRPVLVA